MKEVKIPSGDKKLAAVIHDSNERTGKLAILCPGYLDSKNYAHLVGLAGDLNDQGYTVVRFDPTGTWGSEGDISDYTTTQYLKDIKSVLEYMLQKGNYNFVLLGGHSQGGQLSILYAARDPRISAVLGIMPSSPYSMTLHRREEWESKEFNISFRDIPGKTGKIEFRVPYSHIRDRDQYNVLEDVKKVHGPIIFVAGELDTTVLPEHVKMIYDNANEPKKFITIPGIGHDYRHNPEEIKRVNGEILKLLPT